jgi:Cof subfamily protein (haloacid dehalogenase superfamily)
LAIKDGKVMGNKTIDCKLIALDLDGTTLKEGGWLSDATREAIIAALDAGYIVVPTTGRTLSEIPDEMMSISGIRYVIAANGARVMDLVNGEEIFSDLITLDTTKKIIEHLYTHDLIFQVYSEGVSYCDERFMAEVVRFFGDTDSNYSWLAERIRFVQHLPSYFEKAGRQTEKITVNSLTGEKRIFMEKVLSEIPTVAATSSDPINMEINSATANKGAALLQLSQVLGISNKHILAIGDGDNDIEMLSFAGFSVAMANASPGAKRAASYLTVSNNDDGVPVVFRKFLGIQ